MTLFLSLLTVITCAKKHVVTFPSVNLITYQDPDLTGIASLGAFFALLIRVLGGAGGGSAGAGGGSTVGSSILLLLPPSRSPPYEIVANLFSRGSSQAIMLPAKLQCETWQDPIIYTNITLCCLHMTLFTYVNIIRYILYANTMSD